jgi:hypothetical protein
MFKMFPKDVVRVSCGCLFFPMQRLILDVVNIDFVCYRCCFLMLRMLFSNVAKFFLHVARNTTLCCGWISAAILFDCYSASI